VKARGRNECCHTPLTLAASRGHLELVDLLLDNGAPTEAVTKFRVSITKLSSVWHIL